MGNVQKVEYKKISNKNKEEMWIEKIWIECHAYVGLTWSYMGK